MSLHPLPQTPLTREEVATPQQNFLSETGSPCRDLMLGMDHPYFCSDCNYYSNDATLTYATLADFLDEFEEFPVDLNLCFRWDIRPKDEDQPEMGYRAEVFLMLQRKGLFRPCLIETVFERDLPRFGKYLEAHWAKIQAIWKPFTHDTKSD